METLQVMRYNHNSPGNNSIVRHCRQCIVTMPIFAHDMFTQRNLHLVYSHADTTGINLYSRSSGHLRGRGLLRLVRHVAGCVLSAVSFAAALELGLSLVAHPRRPLSTSPRNTPPAAGVRVALPHVTEGGGGATRSS